MSNILTYIGRNSLIILIFHNPIQRALFSTLDTILGRKFYGSLLAFSGAVLACLFIAEVLKRIPYVRWFEKLTPIRSKIIHYKGIIGVIIDQKSIQ